MKTVLFRLRCDCCGLYSPACEFLDAVMSAAFARANGLSMSLVVNNQFAAKRFASQNTKCPNALRAAQKAKAELDCRGK